MIKTIPLYPIKFEPQLIPKVWGGAKLRDLFGKICEDNIGESWEISDVSNHVSVIINGPLAGNSLTEVIELYGADLLGTHVAETYGATFPLLFKFIDARQDLSVQLHPDDAVAKERHNSFGKTEMWYIMDADPDARLILGFNRDMDEATYTSYLDSENITEILHAEKVVRGDAFYIAPGTVHAIGAGVVLAEIQQTSNITYRIYDWDRPGMDGKMRELHNDLAVDVIDYSNPKTRLEYEVAKNTASELCTSPFFSTHVLECTKSIERDLSAIDSFVVYMCVDGQATLTAANISEELKRGETLLIPASIELAEIETTGCTLLEVYVPSKV